eukprot:Skav234200  [mRNA]  locus=scaffold2795:19378:21295:+ [translate_table: standard]
MFRKLPLDGHHGISAAVQIFQKLGTPNEEVWPGLRELPNFKLKFPCWAAKGWDKIRNTKSQVGAVGIDLLEKFMAYDPKKRWTARKGLQHPYFQESARQLKCLSVS